MSYVARSRPPLRKLTSASTNRVPGTTYKKTYEHTKKTPTGFDLTSLMKNAPTRVPSKKTTPPKSTPVSKPHKTLQPSPPDDRESINVNGQIYHIINAIGSGGSSMVYKVENDAKEKFAMKIVNLSAQKSDVREALLKEIEILKLFKGSKRIIQMIDSYEDIENERMIIIQELGGEDLRSYLEKNLVDYNFKQIMKLWIHMLEAVKECHDKNILHADLKPENFIFVKGKLKLIDFGIALKVGTYSQNTTSVLRDVGVGTLSYMAPESINLDCDTKVVGRPADIWALGSILYRLVFKSMPFPQTNEFVKMGAICGKIGYEPKYDSVPGCAKNPYELPILVETIKSCLVRDPKQRITANELIRSKCVVKYKLMVILLDFINYVQENLPIDISEPDAANFLFTRQGTGLILDFIGYHAYAEAAMARADYENTFCLLGEEIIKQYSDSLFDCELGDEVISRLSDSYLKGEPLSVQITLRAIYCENKPKK